MNLGYDYIVIETYDILSFLKQAKRHQLTLFHLHQLDEMHYSFYVPIYQRYLTYSMHLPIQKSIGLLHYLLLIFKFPQLIFTIAFYIDFILFFLNIFMAIRFKEHFQLLIRLFKKILLI